MEIITEIYAGNIDRVRELIERSGIPDTALQTACECGNLAIVKLLIKKGASIHSQDDDDALRTACRLGYIRIVRFLVENGANIRANNDESFIVATMMDHINIVRFLLSRYSDDRLIDHMLFVASAENSIETAKFLLDIGAEIHDNFLIIACKKEHFEMVKLLVENGANIHANNDEPFQLAYNNNDFNILSFLEEKEKEEQLQLAMVGMYNEGSDLNILDSHFLNENRIWTRIANFL